MSANLAVVAAPRRREILRLVWSRERAAGEIAAAMPDVTFGAVSQHLALLAREGLVTCRRDGRRRWYAAEKSALAPLRRFLEASWEDALAVLKTKAELEAARRGPRKGKRRRTT